MARTSPKQAESSPLVQVADTDALREEIFRFRYEIFYEECGRDAPGTDHEARMIRDAATANIVHLYVRKEGRIVGTVRVDLPSPEGFSPQVRDWFSLDAFDEWPQDQISASYQIMVAPEWRSTPILGQLARACYQLGRDHGIQFGFCGASPHLVKLYESLGFLRYKENIAVEGHGYQVPMVIVSEDIEHLAQVRSPFLKIARRFPNSPRAAEWFRARFPRGLGHGVESLMDSANLRSKLESRLAGTDAHLLSGLSSEARAALLCAGTVLKCKAGDKLMRQNEGACGLAFILSGSATESRDIDGMELFVARRTRGEALGVLAYDGEERRSFDVVADSDMEILVLTPPVVKRTLRSHAADRARWQSNVEELIECGIAAWIEALSAKRKAA